MGDGAGVGNNSAPEASTEPQLLHVLVNLSPGDSENPRLGAGSEVSIQAPRRAAGGNSDPPSTTVMPPPSHIAKRLHSSRALQSSTDTKGSEQAVTPSIEHPASMEEVHELGGSSRRTGQTRHETATRVGARVEKEGGSPRIA